MSINPAKKRIRTNDFENLVLESRWLIFLIESDYEHFRWFNGSGVIFTSSSGYARFRRSVVKACKKLGIKNPPIDK